MIILSLLSVWFDVSQDLTTYMFTQAFTASIQELRIVDMGGIILIG